jgi:hypothetical protein
MAGGSGGSHGQGSTKQNYDLDQIWGENLYILMKIFFYLVYYILWNSPKSSITSFLRFLSRLLVRNWILFDGAMTKIDQY